MSIQDWLDRIDTELAENEAERDAHPADATVEVLVELGRLPKEALDWPGHPKGRAK